MNLGLHILSNPAGTYSFVGSIPMDLAFEYNDGSEISDPAIVDELARSNLPAMVKKKYGIVTRTWKTREDAEKEATRLGYNVSS